MDCSDATSSFCIVNVREYDYWTMVYQSGIITQHISSIVIFIAIFINLQLQSLSATQLIWIGSTFTGLGYLFWNIIVKNHSFRRNWSPFESVDAAV